MEFSLAFSNLVVLLSLVCKACLTIELVVRLVKPFQAT